jgi:DNA replication protein DnaC
MNTKDIFSEDILIELKDFIIKPQGFIIFFGKNGRGKTYAAMKIYERMTPYKLPHKDNDLAIFVNQATLNMQYSDEISEYGSAIKLMGKMIDTRFLVLDDLGTRVPSASFGDFLYAIIDARTVAKLSCGTIITTNLDAVRIRKDLGDAIFSRIASGRNYVFKGDDRRFNGNTPRIADNIL